MTALSQSPDSSSDSTQAPRDEAGRFAGGASIDELLDFFTEVAAAATDGDIDAMLELTAAEWEEARAAFEGVMPQTASAYMRAIGVSWHGLRRLSVAGPQRAHLLGVLTIDWTADVPDALMHRALRAVAHRLGESPNPTMYDAEVIRIEKERVRSRRERFDLPNSATIRGRYDSWADACTAAGIAPPSPRPKSQPPAEVLVDCVRELGCVPTKRWFEAWCQARGRALRNERYGAIIDEAKKIVAAAGETWPDRCESGLAMPDVPADPVRVDRGRPRGYWTKERLLDAACRFLEATREAGEKPTQATLRRYAHERADLDLPQPSVINKRGGLVALLDEARTELKNREVRA